MSHISWKAKARPKQIAPSLEEDWSIWLIQTGRGWGKNFAASNNIIEWIKQGYIKHIALIAPSAADARDYMIDEARMNGGILSNSTSDFFPHYIPSKRRIEWPNGAVGITYSAEDAEQLRGPTHDFFWADEIAAWPANTREQVWSNLSFALRGGLSRGIVTSTPRPINLVRMIRKLEGTIITTGASQENLHNLSETYFNKVIKPYIGTKVGRQEIEGILLEENDLALWDMSTIDKNRIDEAPEQLETIVVGVDPTGSKSGHGVGIVVGGKAAGIGYLLDDRSLDSASPNQWAMAVINAYDDWMANYIVVENNFGGEMVANTIRLVCQSIGHPQLPIKEVHATRGKVVRAEPISSLSQQERIKHVGIHSLLEDQLYDFESGDNDDRADAYVWVFTDLIGNSLRKVKPYAGDAKDKIRYSQPQQSIVGNIWNKVW